MAAVGLTLYKYIFNEIWPTFLVSLFVAIFIILATRMLSIIEPVVNKGRQAGKMGIRPMLEAIKTASGLFLWES